MRTIPIYRTDLNTDSSFCVRISDGLKHNLYEHQQQYKYVFTYTWCGYKITKWMLEHLLFKKLHNRNFTLCVLPSPIPTLLHGNLPLLKAMLQGIFWQPIHELRHFCLTASTGSNLVPFNTDLICGNKQMLYVSRSGEYGRCSNMVTLCFVKNVLTDRALCAGVLSWWRTHEAFFHISALLLLTRSRRFV